MTRRWLKVKRRILSASSVRVPLGICTCHRGTCFLIDVVPGMPDVVVSTNAGHGRTPGSSRRS